MEIYLILLKNFTKYKKPNTEIALIQWGTMESQKLVSGILENIVETVQKENIGNPSIIIVGKVVNMHKKIDWFQQQEQALQMLSV